MKIHAILVFAACGFAHAQTVSPQEVEPSDDSPSSNLLVTTQSNDVADEELSHEDTHALRQSSLFAIVPTEPREFHKHDLVQIIVREVSRAKSSQELETDKDFELDAQLPRWPNMSLNDLFDLKWKGDRTSVNPDFRLDVNKDFKGEGDYERNDDFTARLSAEVIEILPNGNLVLEAHTFIRTDEEESTIKVTGMCRSEDVTAANTILSNQIHDLMIEKIHSGELKKSSEKGIIAKVLETIFAF